MGRMIVTIDHALKHLAILEGTHILKKCATLQEGYQTLLEHFENIDLIVLDSTQQSISETHFLEQIRIHPDINKIPVIILTTSSAEVKSEDNLELGVHYYLTKPFSAATLKAIATTAIDLYTKKRKLVRELKHSETLFTQFDKIEFTIRDLKDIDLISIRLAKFFPCPEKVILGISELLINAVEHGNAEITYDEKTKLNFSGAWREEVERRLNLPEYKNKEVKIRLTRKQNELILYIADQGKGFDYTPYLDFDPIRKTDNHGRGIAYANNLSFDSIQYLGCGNEVECKVQLPFSSATHAPTHNARI